MVGGEAVMLEGETGETLLIEGLDDDCAGEYFCRVTQRYLGTEMQADSDRAVVSVVPRDALVFNGGLLPVARARSTYRATIAGAAGGEAPYEYTWDEAKLPDGFKLTRTAGGLTLSGVPSKAGVSTFDITCKDARGETGTAHFVLVVQAKRVKLAFEGGNFVYSGDAQAPEVTGVPKACEGDLKVRYYGTGGTHYSSSEAPTDAGTYRAVATLRSNGYIGAASRKFRIAPAKLKVKVDDVERFEGEMNPAFTSSLKSSADTSGVKVEYSCVADESSPAGEYQIEATVTDPNFDVTVEPGTLTVKKKQEPVNPDPVVPDPDKPDGPIRTSRISRSPATRTRINPGRPIPTSRIQRIRQNPVVRMTPQLIRQRHRARKTPARRNLPSRALSSSPTRAIVRHWPSPSLQAPLRLSRWDSNCCVAVARTRNGSKGAARLKLCAI